MNILLDLVNQTTIIYTPTLLPPLSSAGHKYLLIAITVRAVKHCPSLYAIIMIIREGVESIVIVVFIIIVLRAKYTHYFDISQTFL